MRFWLSALLVCCALIAAAYGTFEHIQADRAVVEMREREPYTVKPQLSAPLKMRQSFRVNCATVDGGPAVACGTPMDGGSSGAIIPASSLYVAPIVGSAVKIRVGPADVTSAKGYEIGPSARDGVGVQADVSGCFCVSEGAAQQADVVVLQ